MGRESTCSVGDLGSIPGLGRSPGGGHGSPLQYSCPEKPMDRGAWQATAHGVVAHSTAFSKVTGFRKAPLHDDQGFLPQQHPAPPSMFTTLSLSARLSCDHHCHLPKWQTSLFPFRRSFSCIYRVFFVCLFLFLVGGVCGGVLQELLHL